jgi:broad specificity phosphatase PhoE
METRLVYLVRHGEIWREDDRSRYVGQLDVPLSDRGRRQAAELGRRLRRAGIAGLFASDLSRARETAEIAGDALGLPCTQLPELREVSLGEWEGLPVREVARQFPGEYRARGLDMGRFRPPGGESFEDCSARVVPAFHRILASTRGDLLLVCHAGVNRLLLCHVLGMLPANLFRLGQGYGCCNLIRQEGTSYQLLLLNGRPSDLPRVRPAPRPAARRRPVRAPALEAAP